MKVSITAKNYKPSERIQENIEKKFARLGKYFQVDVTANVLVSKFKDKTKIEATINAKQTIFRAEEAAENVYEALDLIIDRLSSQMSKYKGKLEARYKENKALKFEFIPDVEEKEDEGEIKIARTKKFELQPMTAEEAVLQMELLGHNFFVFLDMDTNGASIVYKRKNGDYGLIETDR